MVELTRGEEDYSVTLPDSLMMSQQTRSFGPAAKLKMVSDHYPTGDVLEVDPHHMDSSDLPGHGNTGDRCSEAGRRQIVLAVLATNRNGGMLRLNATRHDDDGDDGEEGRGQMFTTV